MRVSCLDSGYAVGTQTNAYLFVAVDYVLFMQKYVDLELNLNEVQDTRYVDKQELRDLLEMAKANAKDQNGRPVTISPWFGLMCEKFFFDWWDKMDIIVKKNGLEDKEFASNIHNLGSVRA